jgi:hypothetical protein
MTIELCINAPSLEEMTTAFTNAGFVDGENGYWVDGSNHLSSFMIDDAGSGFRWDALSNPLPGAWCCCYLEDDFELPAEIAAWVHADTGDCCGLASAKASPES